MTRDLDSLTEFWVSVLHGNGDGMSWPCNIGFENGVVSSNSETVRCVKLACQRPPVSLHFTLEELALRQFDVAYGASGRM